MEVKLPQVLEMAELLRQGDELVAAEVKHLQVRKLAYFRRQGSQSFEAKINFFSFECGARSISFNSSSSVIAFVPHSLIKKTELPGPCPNCRYHSHATTCSTLVQQKVPRITRPSPEETRLFLQDKEQVPEARGAKHIDITMKLHHNKAQS